MKDKVYCLWLHYLWNIVIKMKQPLIHLRPCTKKGRQDCCQQCRIFVPLLIVCCVNQESLFNPTLIRSQSLIIHSNNQVLVKVSKPYPQVSWLLKITSVMPLERSAHCNLQNVFSFFHRIKNCPYWELWNIWPYGCYLSYLTLTSVCIFSKLFTIHFLQCCWGEFV